MNTLDTPQWLERIGGLASQLVEGDLSALGPLFDLIGPRLVRYASALLRNDSDAEDVVQTAIVRLARHPESLAAARMPWAYCLQVVRNEAMRLLSKRRQTVMLPEQSLASPFRSWSIEEEETRQQVLRAVRRLPDEQGEVVILKVWENLTFLEIAAVTGESPNTVASRYRYALEKLERSLESLAEEVCDVSARR
ncbi:MAG: RNA polymerase sigma factor [Planctomycetaceae bacterium]